VQMPAGVPVATVGIGNARNAGLLAARIIGSTDASVQAKLDTFRTDLRDTAVAKGATLRGLS
jgi:5-(carboxyamino)imidazole ribonucleotide mutase